MNAPPAEVVPPRRLITEDWLAMLCAAVLLAAAVLAVIGGNSAAEGYASPLKEFIGKPVKWASNPLEAFAVPVVDAPRDWSPVIKTLGACGVLLMVLTIALRVRNHEAGLARQALALVGMLLLATLAYLLSAQTVIQYYNLEYVIWALVVGLVIAHTIGTPAWLAPAVQSELYIKTGLVLLGAEVLMPRLLALGLPGICVSWIVTPVVLITTYLFGQHGLRIPSRSLNMVISADMSVCGVSAAIATGAACKAKKEELSLAIGLSLAFTAIMMVVMPPIIRQMQLDDTVAGAWIGGTIDSTGAVAAAGASISDQAAQVAATVKMIQNILIGVVAFGVATYWVTSVEREEGQQRPSLSLIWRRFPRFVLGFVAVSIVFSLIHALAHNGPELVDAATKGVTVELRGWFFCLAFVSIGLETRWSELSPYLRGGKPLVLYVCGQALNLVLTLAMAWLMFGVLFKDYVK